MRDVAMVGAGMIKFGRYPEKAVHELAAQAALLAMQDAGVTMRDIELLASGNLYQASAMIGQRILKEIGQTGIPVINVANACATGSTAFREAYTAVASGAYDVAMCVGSEQMGKMGLLGGGGASSGGISPEGIVGSGLMPAVCGQARVEHMRTHGPPADQFAKTAVHTHHPPDPHPYSQYQVEMSLEDVMNARTVAWPNTLYMCCPTGDGAAAAILMSMDKAKQYTTEPIKVLTSTLTSDPYTERDLTMPDVNTLTKNASKLAYEDAGVGAEDLDLVELHDCFATAEMLHYENLGLCGEGEAGKLIDDKETYVGGRIPVNASGGLLSKGHPLGATGVANIIEIYWHIKGQAGNRQVEGAKTGLAHVIGLGSACTIHILQK